MSHLSSRADIRELLTERQAELLEYPSREDDTLSEIADDLTPIYNRDILSEWTELPLADMDAWKEWGYDANRNEGGIFELMKIDLVIYYLAKVREYWEEMKSELEEEENN